MNVRLNEQQRSEIRTTVINAHGAPRVSEVDFDVTVRNGDSAGQDTHRPGTRDAGADRARVAYEDEVVIVNPNDMKIVAVVPV